LVAPRYASPPPSEPVTRATPVAFNPDTNTHGYFPKPKYPPSELSARHQGRVVLSVVVSQSGRPQNVTIKQSSGWSRLDNAALEKVRDDWDFGAGPIRYYYIPLVYQIQ
jgi:protein TonB